MRSSITKRLTVGFSVALAFIIANAIVAYHNTKQLIANERMVVHTHRVIVELKSTFASLNDAETGQRGYLITNNPAYLEPYFEAIANNSRHTEQLDILTADNPIKQKQVALLEQKIADKLKELQQKVALQQANQTEQVQQMILSDKGKQLMDEIRDIIHDMQRAEYQLLEQRAQESQINFQQAIATSSLAALLNIALLIFLYYFIRRDLSDRFRSEQKIREQAMLLDIATDAIFVRDLSSRILYWNQGAEKLYGWQAHEILGKKATDLLDINYSSQLDKIQNEVLKDGFWQGELNQVTRTSQKIIVESRYSLMWNAQGTPKSILVVNTDITEKKKLETQFLRTQRMESLGTLASGIAHDLNNVLAPILMSVQLLQMDVMSERNQKLLTTMEASIKRAAALVKQVLSFARGMEGDRTTIQIKHLIAEVEHIAQETFPKSIELHSDIASDLLPIYGNATQLNQVFMNLFLNARDAMPHGGKLSVCAENQYVDKYYVRMNMDAKIGMYIVTTITDTGIGIAPENLERIFEPFFTTKELGKGTGLGLSTALGIIKSHGGFINVYSELEKGTQFTIYLPSAEKQQFQSASTEAEVLTGKGELVLVVDDEVAIREMTKLSLETYNYRVLLASDGVEALALYAQHKEEIEVVLLDMMMPVMDGPITIRTLQKMNPHVKIIAISGLVANDKVAESSGSGVRAFLSKPCTAKELLKTIDAVKRS